MNEEKISVIIPVYNVQECLDLSIKSILDQTYSNLEIILVDDGSTDRSGDICDEWGKMDDRIKVFHKKNGGLSDARNYGLQMATGDYISFIDSDDYIDSMFYEKLYSLIKHYNVDISCCRFDIFDEIEYAPWYSEAPIADGHDECMDARLFLLNTTDFKHGYTTPSVWDRLYHRSVLEGIEFPKGKNYEDVFFSTYVISKSKKIAFLDECLYHYRVRKGSLSNGGTILDKRVITDLFYLRDKQLEYLDEIKYHDVLTQYRAKYVAEAAYYFSFNPYKEYDNEIILFIAKWKFKLCDISIIYKYAKKKYILKAWFPFLYSKLIKVKNAGRIPK